MADKNCNIPANVQGITSNSIFIEIGKCSAPKGPQELLKFFGSNPPGTEVLLGTSDLCVCYLLL